MNGSLRSTAAMKLLATLALPLLLSACSTAPSASSTEGRLTDAGGAAHRIVTEGALAERTFEASAGDVWRTLQLAYQEMEIPVTGVREDVHRLETMNLVTRRIDGDPISTFLDCGSGVAGPRANTWGVSLTLVVTVRPGETSGSRLRIETDGWAEPRGTSGTSVHCQSRNELEDRIFENVSRRLAVRGSPDA